MAKTRDLASILDELRPALRLGIAALAENLLGARNPAVSTRTEWRWGSKGAFRVIVSGANRGACADFESDWKGDPLALIMRERGCDFESATLWGAAWAGIDTEGRAAKAQDPAARRQRDADRERARTAAEAQEASDQRDAIRRAFHWWNQRKPLTATIGATYLASRGIKMSAHGWPDAVAFLPASSVTIGDDDERRTYPAAGAVILCATDASGAVCGVQRVYVDANGANVLDDAGGKIKRTTGALRGRGAVVRLPGLVDGPVLLAEGPETGLSLWYATGYETRIAIGAMPNHVPPIGRKVVVCRDDDRAQSPADKALGRALAAWRETGADVVVATPWPVRRFDKSDFNDTLVSSGPGAVRARIDAALFPGRPPGGRLPVADARRALGDAIDGFFSATTTWDGIRQKAQKRAEAELTNAATFPLEVIAARHARATARATSAAVRVAKSIIGANRRRAVLVAKEAAVAARVRARAASEAARPFKGEVAKVQRQITAAAAKAGRTAAGPPPVHAVKVDVGVGKSAATRRAVAALLRRMRDAGDQRAIAIAVPTHTLGTEQATLFETEPDAVTAGLHAAIWRGREAKDPDEPGRPMCQDLDAIADAREALADPQTAVCRKAGPESVLECPFFNECAYQRQRSAKADVWFVAHEMLFLHRPAALGDLAVVVVDESAWQDGLSGADGNHIRISLDTLDQPDEVPGAPIEGQRLRYLRRMIHSELVGLQDGPIPRSAVLNAGISPEAAGEARAIEWMRKADVEIYPNMPTRERKAAVRAAAVNRTIARLANFWRALEALAREDGPEASGWAALAVVDTQEGPVRVIRLKGCKPIGTDWDVPTLIIDAILQPALIRPFWPGAVLTADIQVETPHQHVRQVVDRSYSKARMSKSTALRDVHATICREARRHAPSRALVVTQMDAEEALPEIGPLPVNVELAHHNAIAGRDEWGPGSGRQGISLLIVVGRTAPPPAAVERMAEALTGAAIAPLPGWYETADAMREMVDGSAVPTQSDRHPHPVVEAVRWQIAEGELVQIIGRARGVNRTAANPVEILVMTDTPLPVPVSQAIHAADLDPSPADLMMAAGGVALENPTDAAAAYPQLWKNRDSAKKAMERRRDASILGTNPYKVVPIRECPQDRRTLLAFTTYQLPGHGKRPAVAWVDLGLIPDPAAWLDDRLGPLVRCELVHIPTQEAPTHHAQKPEAAPVPTAKEIAAMSDANKRAIRAKLRGDQPAPERAAPDFLGGYGDLLACNAFVPISDVALYRPDTWTISAHRLNLTLHTVDGDPTVIWHRHPRRNALTLPAMPWDWVRFAPLEVPLLH